MRAAGTVRKPPTTIECDRTITEAAQLMDQHAVGAVVVTDRSRPVGIVADRLTVTIGRASSSRSRGSVGVMPVAMAPSHLLSRHGRQGRRSRAEVAEGHVRGAPGGPTMRR
jgi:CBS domain-containing protein